MNTFDTAWANDEVRVSDRIIDALALEGRHPKRFQVVDALARELRVPTEDLRDAGYTLFVALIRELERTLEEPAGNWADDVLTGRARRIAEAAVDALYLDDLIATFEECHWRNPPLRDVKRVNDVRRAVREAAVKKLEEPIRKMLEAWRKRRLWGRERTVTTSAPPSRQRLKGSSAGIILREPDE